MDALRSQARKGVRTRIVYDHATDPGPGPEVVSTVVPSHLEADQKPPGTDSFVRSFANVAQVKGITGYRVLLMHNKYILRDADSAAPRRSAIWLRNLAAARLALPKDVRARLDTIGSSEHATASGSD